MRKVFGIAIFVLLLSSVSMAINPEFHLDKQVYFSDDTIKINYTNVVYRQTNWIGIWRYKDGPGSNKLDIGDGPWHQDQTTSSDFWEYIPHENGQVIARNLTPGRYAAFLLNDNGYRWLSNPVIFDIMDTDNIFKLKTLMFKIWQEGTSVSGGFDGIVNEIIASGADIVSLAEVRNYNGVNFTKRLVNELNSKGFKFYSYQSTNDVGVVSRFPIKNHVDFDAFTKSNIDVNNATVTFYSCHLDYTHYATYLPRGYDANFSGKLDKPVTNVSEILKANDESARPESIKAFLDDARTPLINGNVVIMAGDFNEPSWLDWTNETKDMFDHNGVIVPWTSTKLLSDAGFQDAYRAKYPDPVQHPGFSWVSDNPAKAINQLTWAPTADERDRIDFTFYYPHKQLSVEDAIIVGPSTSIVRSRRVKETGSDKFKEPEGVWPSDHKAVLITFNLLMGSTFSLDKQVYASDDTIIMSYANIPFDETNWIGIWRYRDGPGSNKLDIGDGPWHQDKTTSSDIWEYIPHENGQLKMFARNLTPGRYAAFILNANGYRWLRNPVIFDIMDTNNIFKLKTLMFNIWQEGTSVSGGFDGIVNEIIASGADIVSLAEVRNYNGVNFTKRLVNELNSKGFKFYSYQSTNDVGVVSRFPIKSHTDFDRFTKSKIRINNVAVGLYSCHLDYRHYATHLPRGYDANFSGKLDKPVTNVSEILKANDESARPESIKAFLDDARTELSNGNIVIMSGDFNEPSWLDWTNETKDMFDHNGVIVPWTSTKLLSDAGFQDAYRAKYPEPVKYPGFSWVSDNPDKAINQLTWAPTADERDRIDFTFFYPDKRLSVEDAIIVGPSTSIVRSRRVKETGSDKFKEPEGVWPSDHKAVLITFNIGDRVPSH